MQHRVWSLDNTHKASLLKPEQRVVLHILCLNSRVMSTEFTKEEKLEIAQRAAAHQLMTQFVTDNASDVAHVLETLVPFINGESSLSDLKGDMNTVNITFATVALDVIRLRNMSDGKGITPLSLPVDATQMQNALYDLSRFFKAFSPLASFIEDNEGLPAFKMCNSCFDTVDSL